MHGDQQHVLVRRARRSSRPRISGPRARSNGVRASPAQQPPQLGLRPAASPSRSCSQQMEPARLHGRDALHRLAVHLHEGRAQRLVPRDDRVQRTPQRRPRPARRCSRSARGDVDTCRPARQLLQEPQPLLREGQRQPPAAVHRLDGRQLGARRALERVRARSASTGVREQPASGSSTPSTCRTRDMTRAASSEWPPSSKKSSRRPTRSTPSTSAQMPASASLRLARAAPRSRASRRHRPPARAAPCGPPCRWASAAARRAARTPPAPCTPAAPLRAGAPAAASASAVAHDVGHQPLVARHVLARQHHGLAHVRRARPARASISPSSMRKPRTFTWWSVRPRNSSCAVRQRQRARSPVRYSRAPGSPPNGSGTKRSAVSSGRSQVAARDARAADAQLARHADRHRLARRVQHVDARVGQGPADGHLPAGGGIGADRLGGGPDGGLGGPVDVPERAHAAPQRRRQLRRERLAAAERPRSPARPPTPRPAASARWRAWPA